MKAEYGLLPLSYCLSAVLAAAQHKSEVASKFLVLESKWKGAYKRSDIDAMNALVADDFIITTEDGLIYSKAGYIADLAGTSEDVTAAEISDVPVRVRPSVAVVTGTYREEGTSKGKPYEYRDRFTDVRVETTANSGLGRRTTVFL